MIVKIMINKNYLNLSKFQENFRSGKPFPFLILDNFFEKKFFEQISKDLENRKSKVFGKEFDTSVEKNKIINLNKQLPKTIEQILKILTSETWVKNLRILSGVDDLTPDKGHNEVLSNFHEMSKSGFLGSHVDHSHHPTSKKKHVLNIIIYLSKNWDSSFGGNTLLYNEKGKKVEKLIEYIPNRLLIFLHTPYSFHGVDHLKPNQNQVRKTLYLDFYSDLDNPYKHLSLPFKNHFFDHGTTFVLKNKLSYFKPSNFYYTKTLLKYKINQNF